ncbi:hypothetical protein LOC67_05485 [Stieleria sp. JC731]|uniref:hypothetical protein n=1 Tax=Pirellulaceae TaxID=2691357 RepID=UPI001E4C43B0|nr:hypothetical protein [Stieleria sp. JC731]MCC9600006.1 hypothetical protein [Stieleria sp. JC731]
MSPRLQRFVCILLGGCLYVCSVNAQTPASQDSGSEQLVVPPQTLSIGGVEVQLPEPTLDGSEDAERQTEKLKSKIGGLSIRQFTRDSQVAPVRIDLSYIKDDSGARVGHLVHVLFVLHCPLSSFTEGDFAQQLSGETDEASDGEASFAQAVASDELARNGIVATDANQRFRRVKTVLLDKIELNAVLRIENSESAKQNRIDVVLDGHFPATWSSVESGKTDVSLDTDSKGAYSGFQAWLTATELIGSDAVVIEAQIAMHEPQGWFSGSNFLRSKLPLVLQQAARDLRRKLAE